MSFRIIYVLTSIFIIVGVLVKKESRIISSGGLFILLFWMLYSFRLVYDISYKNIIFDSPFYVYSFAFGNCFLPAIAFTLSGKYVDINQLKKSTVKFLIFVNVITSIIVIYTLGGLSIESFSRRAMITNDESKLVLNGIIISYTGEVLCIVSFALILLNKEIKKVKLLLAFLLGLFNLIIGSSRGPMLSFLFCSLFIIFVSLMRIRMTYANIMKIISVVIGIVIFYFIFLITLFKTTKISIILRLISLFESGGTTDMDERPLFFKSAWNQFLSYPILGDQYLSRYSNYYPHNIYLEVLMSLGIIGAVVFIGIHIFSFHKALTLLKDYNEDLFIPFLLLITLLLVGMTSGCLFLGVGLWSWWSLFNSIQKNGDYTISNRVY